MGPRPQEPRTGDLRLARAYGPMGRPRGHRSIGRRVDRAARGTAQIRIAAGRAAPDAAVMGRWITSGAQALVSAYGRLPVPEAQLLVVPVGPGGEPAPMGRGATGRRRRRPLYIEQRRPLEGSWPTGCWCTSSATCSARASRAVTAGCPRGSKSLDTALAAFRDCCLPSERS